MYFENILLTDWTFQISLHRLPHLGLGTVGDKITVYLFFPGIFSGSSDTNPISSLRQSQIYDLMLECVREYLPSRASHFPPSTDAEMARAFVLSSGRYDLRTVDIGQHYAENWSTSLREKIVSHPNLGGEAFYLIQIRNTKGSTVHQVLRPSADEFSMNEWETQELVAFGDLFKNLTYSWQELSDPEAKWHVDVAIEISSSQHTVHWYRPSHFSILQYVLRISEDTARNYQRGHAFKTDAVSSLSDCAGFRMLVPRNLHAEDGTEGTQARYIQAYCTDKTPTYNAGRTTHSNDLSGKALMRALRCQSITDSDCSSLVNWLNSARQIYLECYRQGQQGSARLEVRVPLVIARHMLRYGLPTSLLSSCTLKFPCELLW